MTIVTDQREVEEENPPPMFESEMISKTRRIALFVEPSPFAWVFNSEHLFHFIFHVYFVGKGSALLAWNIWLVICLCWRIKTDDFAVLYLVSYNSRCSILMRIIISQDLLNWTKLLMKFVVYEFEVYVWIDHKSMKLKAVNNTVRVSFMIFFRTEALFIFSLFLFAFKC